ncbi:24322_t:CDS:2, partial [Racocetra persica]
MSDNTTYEDWGMVINWSGEIKSNLSFGISSSYLKPDNSWNARYNIIVNIDPRKGFLCYSPMPKTNYLALEQYTVDNNGKITLLQSDTIEIGAKNNKFNVVEKITTATINSTNASATTTTLINADIIATAVTTTIIPTITPTVAILSNQTIKTFYKIRFLSTGAIVALNQMFTLN